MIARLGARVSSPRAAAALREAFGSIAAPFAFRLWDGTEVRLGGEAPPVTVVVKSPATFLRLLARPTPLIFAEAYVESAIDVEGDLAAAMIVADALEELRLPPTRRLRLLAALLVP